MKQKKDLKEEIKQISQTSEEDTEEDKQRELATSIEILQNNGVFRNALLNQLIQINQNLARLTGQEVKPEVKIEETDEEDEDEEEDDEE